MQCTRKITDSIYWVGVNDRRLNLFENIFPIPKGVSYNAYLITDEKTALLDTVDGDGKRPFFENIRYVLDGRKLDYLIVNHMEPDHTGAIKNLLCHYPDLTVVGNCKTFPMLQNYYGVDSNLLEVKEGDSLNIGKRTLNFYMVPMLHWPETMVTYLPGENIVFSGDVFGAFGTLDGGIFDDQVDLDYLEEEISRYYSNIVGKYGMPAQTALKKLNTLTFNTICATHGPIWRSHVCDIIAKYEKWSKYETEEGVVIAEQGVKKIRIHDTSKTHPSYIINDIFRYKGVILGSCAYNGGIFPTMETLLCELENMGIKNHLLAYFGNKTWGGGAIPRLKAFAEKMKWEVVAEPNEALGAMKSSDIEQCKAIAQAMAEKIKKS